MSEPHAAAGGLVRVYPAAAADRSASAAGQPGLVWLHGGGFVAGDLDMPEADHVARTLAAAGITVVSVDYRLAPLPADDDTAAGHVPQSAPADEHVRERAHFPAASDDAIRAWQWTLGAAADLGVDPDRLALGGASAGANIATGAVLRLLASGGRPPALVLLAYPTLLAVQPAPGPALRAALDAEPEADRFGHAAVLGMYETYLGRSPIGAPLAAVPGLATTADLAEFPATLIVSGDVDELRVSAEMFADRLAGAGRPVEHVVEPGTQHGHLNRPAEPAASLTLDRFAARIAALPAPVTTTLVTAPEGTS